MGIFDDITFSTDDPALAESSLEPTERLAPDTSPLSFLGRVSAKSTAANGTSAAEDAYGSGIGALVNALPFFGSAVSSMAASQNRAFADAAKTGRPEDASFNLLSAGSANGALEREAADWDAREGAKYDAYAAAAKGRGGASAPYVMQMGEDGRYHYVTDDEGNKILDESYAGGDAAKQAARAEHMKAFSREILRQRAQDVSMAEGQVEADDERTPWYSPSRIGASVATDIIPLGLEFMVGGAGVKALAKAGRIKGLLQAAGEGSKAAKLAATQLSLIAPIASSAMRRYNQLRTDDFGLDEDGNLVIDENALGTGAALRRGIAGAVIESELETYTGDLAGKFAKATVGRALKGIANASPAITKLFQAGKDKAVGAVPQGVKDAVLRFADGYGKIQRMVGNEVKFNDFITEDLEEWTQGVADDVFGFGNKDQADNKSLAEFTRDFLSWDKTQKDLLPGLIVGMAGMGAAGAGIRNAQVRMASAGNSVKSTLKGAGFSDSEIGGMTYKERIAAASQIDPRVAQEIDASLDDLLRYSGLKEGVLRGMSEEQKKQAAFSAWIALNGYGQKFGYQDAVPTEEDARKALDGMSDTMQGVVQSMMDRNLVGDYRELRNNGLANTVGGRVKFEDVDEDGRPRAVQDGNGDMVYTGVVRGSDGSVSATVQVRDVNGEGKKFTVSHTGIGNDGMGAGLNEATFSGDNALENAFNSIDRLDRHAQMIENNRAFKMKVLQNLQSRIMLPGEGDAQGPLFRYYNTMDDILEDGTVSDRAKSKVAEQVANGKSTPGFRLPDGTFAFVLDEIKDYDDLVVTFVHEVLGHGTINEFFDNDQGKVGDVSRSARKTGEGANDGESDKDAEERVVVARSDARQKGGEALLKGFDPKKPGALRELKTKFKLWLNDKTDGAVTLGDEDLDAIAAWGLKRLRQREFTNAVSERNALSSARAGKANAISEENIARMERADERLRNGQDAEPETGMTETLEETDGEGRDYRQEGIDRARADIRRERLAAPAPESEAGPRISAMADRMRDNPLRRANIEAANAARGQGEDAETGGDGLLEDAATQTSSKTQAEKDWDKANREHRKAMKKQLDEVRKYNEAKAKEFERLSKADAASPSERGENYGELREMQRADRIKSKYPNLWKKVESMLKEDDAEATDEDVSHVVGRIVRDETDNGTVGTAEGMAAIENNYERLANGDDVTDADVRAMSAVGLTEQRMARDFGYRRKGSKWVWTGEYAGKGGAQAEASVEYDQAHEDARDEADRASLLPAPVYDFMRAWMPKEEIAQVLPSVLRIPPTSTRGYGTTVQMQFREGQEALARFVGDAMRKVDGARARERAAEERAKLLSTPHGALIAVGNAIRENRVSGDSVGDAKAEVDEAVASLREHVANGAEVSEAEVDAALSGAGRVGDEMARRIKKMIGDESAKRNAEAPANVPTEAGFRAWLGDVDPATVNMDGSREVFESMVRRGRVNGATGENIRQARAVQSVQSVQNAQTEQNNSSLDENAVSAMDKSAINARFDELVSAAHDAVFGDDADATRKAAEELDAFKKAVLRDGRFNVFASSMDESGVVPRRIDVYEKPTEEGYRKYLKDRGLRASKMHRKWFEDAWKREHRVLRGGNVEAAPQNAPKTPSAAYAKAEGETAQGSAPARQDAPGEAIRAFGNVKSLKDAQKVLGVDSGLSTEELKKRLSQMRQTTGRFADRADALRFVIADREANAEADRTRLEEAKRSQGGRMDAGEESGYGDEREIRFRERTAPEPESTRTVYKLMRLARDGNGNIVRDANGMPKLQTLFIDRENYEVGKWHDGEVPDLGALSDAEPGFAYLMDRDNNIVDRKAVKGGGTKISGLPSKKSVLDANANGSRWVTKTLNARGSATYANVAINGSEGVATFAMRPGIHAGSLPSMQQIGNGPLRNVRSDDLVWVRGRIDYDEDFAQSVRENGGEVNDAMPAHGYEKGTSSFVTKGMSWYISPSFIADEIISDQEAERVVDEFNRTRERGGESDADVGYDYPREGGRRFYSDTMQVEDRREGDVTDGTKYNVSAQMKNKGISWGDEGVRFRTSGLYTGTSADYDKPSLHYVGTGEGSQVYGWGLYASNQRGVAETYADLDQKAKIGEKHKVDVLWNGKPFKEGEVRLGKLIRDAIAWGEGDYKQASRYLNVIRGNFDAFKAKGDLPKLGVKTVDELDEAERFIEKHGSEFSANVETSHRHVYEQTFFTNRPEGDESHLLSWYEPVSEENAKRIKDALIREGKWDDMFDSRETDIRDEFATGEELYNLIASWESPRGASEFLARADIDGIKYPVDSYGKQVKDGDEAGWNYVSFRDDNITVDHKWVDGEMRFRERPTAADAPRNMTGFEYRGFAPSTDVEKAIDAFNATGAKTGLYDSEGMVRFRLGSVEDALANLMSDPFQDGDKDRHGQETSHVVRRGDKVYKFRLPDNSGDHELEKVALHNAMFPDTAYTVVGIAKDADGRDVTVLEQPYVEFEKDSGPRARQMLLEEMRERFGDAEMRGNEIHAGGWMLDDLKDLNVGIDARTGRPAVIDAIVHPIAEMPEKFWLDVDRRAKDSEGNGNVRFRSVLHGENRDGAEDERTTRLAPNGERSNLTNRQYDQVRTPEFKKWFGDWENDPANASSAVDENGEPLVLYHGTYRRFTEFDKGKQGGDPGFFFAEERTRPKNGWTKEYSEYYGGNVMPVFLRNADRLSRGEWRVENPNDIKSAVGNTGAFDEGNNDIRFRSVPRGAASSYADAAGLSADELGERMGIPISREDDARSRRSQSSVAVERALAESHSLSDVIDATRQYGLGAVFGQVREVAVRKLVDSLRDMGLLEKRLGIGTKGSVVHAMDTANGKAEDARMKLGFKADEIKRLIAENDLNEKWTDPSGRETGMDKFSVFLQAMHGAERNRLGAERSRIVKRIHDAVAANNRAEGRKYMADKSYSPKFMKTLNAVLRDAGDIPSAAQELERLGLMKAEELGELEAALSYSGRTTQEWNDILDRFDREGYTAKATPAAQMVWDMNRETLDRLVASGRISARQAGIWKRLSPHYVPMRTDADGNEDGILGELMGGSSESEGFGKAYSGREFRRATGRTTLADSPLVFSIMQAEQAINRALDNESRAKLAKIVRDNSKIGEVVDFSDSSNWDRMPRRKVVQNGLTTWVPDMSDYEAANDNVVAFKENGDTKYIVLGRETATDENGELDMRTASRIAKSVRRENLAQLGGAMRAVRALSRGFGALRTSLSPTFMVSNVLADQGQAKRNLVATFGQGAWTQFTKLVVPFAKDGAYESVKRYLNGSLGSSQMDRWTREWAENGGRIGGFATESFRDMERELAKDVKDLQDFIDGTRRGKASEFLKRNKDRFDKLAQSFEMGTRVAAYAVCRQNNMSVEDSVRYARDVTVNFNRKGEWSPVTNALWVFSNAGVQDMVRTKDAFLASPHGFSVMGQLFVLGVVSAMLGFGQDDPEDEINGVEQWKDQGEWRKQNGIVARIGGKVLSVPLRGLARIPYYFGHKAFEFMSGNGNGSELRDMAVFAASNLTDPIGNAPTVLQNALPSVLRPLAEIGENTTFTGAKLHRDAYSDRDVASENGRRTTSPVAAWVAKALNRATGGSRTEKGLVDVYPETVAHMAEWLTGTLGRDAAQLAGVAWDLATFTSPESVRKVPGLNRFASDLANNSARYRDALGRYETDAKTAEVYGDDRAEMDALESRAPYFKESNKAWKSELDGIAKSVRKLVKESASAEGEEKERLDSMRHALQGAFLYRLENRPDFGSAGRRAEVDGLRKAISRELEDKARERRRAEIAAKAKRKGEQ